MKAKIYVGAKKYALYIGRKIVEKTLEFLSLPSRFVSNKVQELKNLTMWGQSIQNGTPTPTAPIEIESVGEKQLLPYGYTQLEYIESTGTQYIVIPIRQYVSGEELEIDFAYTAFTGPYPTIYGSIFSEIYTNVYGDALPFGNIQISEPQKFILNQKQKIKASFTNTITTEQGLFAYRQSVTTYTYTSQGKLYKFIDRLNGVDVYNMLPARRNSDGVVGMYDTVTDTFLTNAGEGEFIAGNEIGQGGYKIPVEVSDTTTNIYLNEPLRKIGEYADTLSVNGTEVTVTRNIGSLLLNTVNFSYTSAIKSFYSNVIANTVANNSNVYCEVFKWSDMLSSIWSANDKSIGVNVTSAGTTRTGNFTLKALAIKDTDFTTQTELKNAIGNAKVYYALATPTTETYTIENAIQLEQGTLTIDTDTNIKPSKLSITGDIDNE